MRNFETAVAESTGRRKTRGDLARLNTSFVKRGPWKLSRQLSDVQGVRED